MASISQRSASTVSSCATVAMQRGLVAALRFFAALFAYHYYWHFYFMVRKRVAETV